MKSYNEFYNTRNGIGYASVPVSLGFQCVGLFHEYFRYLFGFQPIATPSALNIWTNRSSVFANVLDKVQFIEDGNLVQAGDICIYKADIQNFTFSNGHVDIHHSGNKYFGQNFACNQFATLDTPIYTAGMPLCPASLATHNIKPNWIIRPIVAWSETAMNAETQSVPQTPLQPNQGIVLGDTNIRPDPSINGTPVETIVQDRPIDCIASVQGQEIEGKTTWIQVSNGYISITRFSQLPSQLNEVAQTPTPPVETPPAPPQVDIPTQNILNFEALDGIRGRTTPRFEDNIYTEISGTGKSVNVLSIVDGAEYQGSNQWVKYMYDDIKTDDRPDIVLYSHRSFFE